MDKLGGGVLGLGTGRRWAQVLAENERTHLAAVFDPNQERVAEVTSQWGGESTRSWQELVERDDVDLVVVASPDAYHAEQAIGALEVGKHVIIEKPMVVTMEQCEAVVAAADRSGKVTMSAYPRRYFPQDQAVKCIIEQGQLGEIFYAEGHYLVNFHFEQSSQHWRAGKEHRHWPLLGSACHAIDLLSWHVGRITEVSAYGNQLCYTSEQYPFWDCQVAACKFETGAIGRLLSAYAPVYPHECRYRLFGTNGTYDGYLERIYRGDQEWEEVPADNSAKKDARAQELEEFIQCIHAGRQPTMDVRNGAYVVAVALAAEESIISGRPVAVRQFAD